MTTVISNSRLLCTSHSGTYFKRKKGGMSYVIILIIVIVDTKAKIKNIFYQRDGYKERLQNSTQRRLYSV